jgi:hypothetical protein
MDKDKMINEIFELEHSSLIKPMNLVENAYLKHYNHVKYYTIENKMNVEMSIKNKNNEEELFVYEFDLNENLQKITQHIKKIKIVLFDRKKALRLKREEYLTLENNEELMEA